MSDTSSTGLSIRLAVEAVRNLNDRRKVAYWRYAAPDQIGYVGAVSRRQGKWRALGYGLDTPSDNRELEVWPTRKEAERAVAEWAPHRAQEFPKVVRASAR